MNVSRGNALCVQNRVTLADEFRPSRRSDAQNRRFWADFAPQGKEDAYYCA